MPYKKASSYRRFNVAAFMQQTRLASDAAVTTAVNKTKRDVDAKRKQLERLDKKVRIQ